MFSREFNWFQYFQVSVLIQFNFSFNIGLEIADDRGGPLQLVFVDFFKYSWMTTRFFAGISFCGC